VSILVYSALTSRREEADSGESVDQSPPGVRTFLDALVALFPAELLSLHVLALALFTQTKDEGADMLLFTITERTGLRAAFVILIILGPVLYWIGHTAAWKNEDYARAVIPAVAFVGWTMIQDNTAFDAWFDWHDKLRFFVPAVGAIILGAIAARLAAKADTDPPPTPPPAPSP
jgi:hypothetical protein